METLGQKTVAEITKDCLPGHSRTELDAIDRDAAIRADSKCRLRKTAELDTVNGDAALWCHRGRNGGASYEGHKCENLGELHYELSAGV